MFGDNAHPYLVPLEIFISFQLYRLLSLLMFDSHLYAVLPAF